MIIPARAHTAGARIIAGISDDKQHLCFALALWNGQDRILKERMFGLTNSEANHGEDVKEYYFYLDSTPTHSYMKTLYKYPQQRPLCQPVQTNSRRSREEMDMNCSIQVYLMKIAISMYSRNMPRQARRHIDRGSRQ